MDRALQYLSLAHKAGLAALGEEAAAAAARAGDAHLICMAADAAQRTWRRAESMTAGTNQKCLRLGCSKEALGTAVGRAQLAVAAFLDPPLALAFLKALDPPPPEDVTQALQTSADRLRQRQEEAKAHQRNKRRKKKEH